MPPNCQSFDPQLNRYALDRGRPETDNCSEQSQLLSSKGNYGLAAVAELFCFVRPAAQMAHGLDAGLRVAIYLCASRVPHWTAVAYTCLHLAAARRPRCKAASFQESELSWTLSNLSLPASSSVLHALCSTATRCCFHFRLIFACTPSASLLWREPMKDLLFWTRKSSLKLRW